MAKRIGPAKIKQCSLKFKLKTIPLSDQPGVLNKDVAESLCIHPFMLSRWASRSRMGSWWATRHRWSGRRPRSCSGFETWRSSSSACRWSTTC